MKDCEQDHKHFSQISKCIYLKQVNTFLSNQVNIYLARKKESPTRVGVGGNIRENILCLL
jgi:hypothetical protein